MARPTKLTAKLTEEIVGYVREGNYPHISAGLAGISRSSFYFWMAQGRDGIAPFSEFSDAIERARCEAISIHVSRIVRVGLNGTWRASAWWLERHAPELYGKNIRKRIVEDDTPFKIGPQGTHLAEIERKMGQVLKNHQERGTK
ncbi:MAG: hypothetical protein Q8K86_04595 [Candidatus Nanopelagicaceae bacterium]|nr:hypothetical protein [Candidatus Nanopelagicaceae bacterium]